MSCARRTLLALACTIGSLLAGVALAGAHPAVGIGDNDTVMFSDPRFLDLGVSDVRDDIAWNAVNRPRLRAELSAWLDAARADGLTPLITFDHVIGSVRTQRKLPSVARFSKAFLKLRKLFPWVTEFDTWDEANFYLEGTAFEPKRAAGYYRALRHDCPTCTILAPDLLDVPRSEAVPMGRWAHRFIHFAHVQPAYWGLNNYYGANRFETRTTKSLLRAVKGKVWFAETGGIVKRVNSTHVHFVQGERHAAKVDRFIFHKLVHLSPRIQRVYLYEWKATSRHDKWDSALISWNDKPRPAYRVLAKTLRAWGVRPNCALVPAAAACAGSTGATTAALTGS